MSQFIKRVTGERRISLSAQSLLFSRQRIKLEGKPDDIPMQSNAKSDSISRMGDGSVSNLEYQKKERSDKSFWSLCH